MCAEGRGEWEGLNVVLRGMGTKVAVSLSVACLGVQLSDASLLPTRYGLS